MEISGTPLFLKEPQLFYQLLHIYGNKNLTPLPTPLLIFDFQLKFNLKQTNFVLIEKNYFFLMIYTVQTFSAKKKFISIKFSYTCVKQICYATYSL